MTLFDTINAIEKVASRQKAVHTLVRNDIFRINAKPDVRYGALAWTQGQHSSSGSMWKFSFSLIYVDRLTNDKSNQTEVQSVGIATIENILRTLEEKNIFPVDGYSFQAFNQRFLDECAGVFCNVTFEVGKDTVCPETYGEGDYNDDYNEDFLIM